MVIDCSVTSFNYYSRVLNLWNQYSYSILHDSLIIRSLTFDIYLHSPHAYVSTHREFFRERERERKLESYYLFLNSFECFQLKYLGHLVVKLLGIATTLTQSSQIIVMLLVYYIFQPFNVICITLITFQFSYQHMFILGSHCSLTLSKL